MGFGIMKNASVILNVLNSKPMFFTSRIGRIVYRIDHCPEIFHGGVELNVMSGAND
jgi:hypothetical protein